MNGQHGDGTWVFNDYTRLHRAIVGDVDGLSVCLDVDDSLFSYTLRRGDKSKAGGVIIDAEIR